MARHELKCWPEFYSEVDAKRKTFEIRENDRHFAVGDELLLREFVPHGVGYSGRSLVRRVTYVTSFQQRPGYVVMGLDEKLR